jgi:hypothetical protein
LTDLSAGGLRSSATVGAARGSNAASARRVGTDPRNGLAAAEGQHARTDRRQSSAAVLGPEACRIRGTKRTCIANSPSAEAGLLRSKRLLLGRSDFVPSPDELERCACSCVLEWSSCEGHFVYRRQTTRITLSRLAHFRLRFAAEAPPRCRLPLRQESLWNGPRSCSAADAAQVIQDHTNCGLRILPFSDNRY